MDQNKQNMDASLTVVPYFTHRSVLKFVQNKSKPSGISHIDK